MFSEAIVCICIYVTVVRTVQFYIVLFCLLVCCIGLYTLVSPVFVMHDTIVHWV